MKPSGTGRILIWRGGSLWIGRSGEPTDFHSHHAVQITLSFSAGGVRFRRPGESWNTYSAAMITAHQAHAFEGRGEFVGMIFVEPESHDGRALLLRCRGEGISPLDKATIERESAAMVDAYKRIAPNPELCACARSIITKLATSNPVPVVSLDKRIAQAVELLHERIGGTVLLAEIADAVFLSPDRFRHLFMQETGMRFRPYVLWLRIEIALAAFASNRSLTEASHAGGFADSAHFSRTFKRMFGIAPSSLQIN